jgi:predicted secreted protein
MATLTGNDGSVVVGSTTVAAVRNFSVEMTADTIETSVMGSDRRTYVKGMSQFSGSADIYFDSSEFDGAETTFNPTTGSVGDAVIAVKLYVKTDATNDQVFYGDVIVTGYTVNSSLDGMVEASISFQGSGAATFSASGNV